MTEPHKTTPPSACRSDACTRDRTDAAEESPDVREALVRERLHALGIAFREHRHRRIMTAEEGIEIARITGGVCVKNLFLYAKREKTWYLLMQPGNKRLNFKTLEAALSVRHLQFGSAEELRRLLGTYPGAVTCLGLVFDTAGAVKVLVDKELTGLDRIDCHPCRNDASFTIALEDILNIWLPATGHAGWRWV